ncbi:hypothetical protein Tco_0771533 [Tanacetum coccineum]|uniref:Uncharacterized protein n=1 Tax=Tanacetum coccineum TaxID=301880 RepID=A0ABQ4ZI79_9ASTR
MHNNIMAAGSKDRPPMLGPGRYSQWRSRFLRYLDTKSNGEYLRKCIFEGPYTPTSGQNLQGSGRWKQAVGLCIVDKEIERRNWKLHYGFMAKIRKSLPAESYKHSEKNAAECADERAALANLIANLTLDTEENKTILKQLKKANASLTQELEKCKTNLDETNSALGEAISSRDSCLIALQTKQTELEKYTALNDRTSD